MVTVILHFRVDFIVRRREILPLLFPSHCRGRTVCATQPYELGAHCRWEGHALEPSEFRAACGITGKRRSPRAESPLLERVALSLRFTSAKPSACLAAPEKDRQPLQYPAELLVWVGSALLSDAAGDLPQDADRASGPRPCGLSDHREKVNTHRGALPVSGGRRIRTLARKWKHSL